ncbi:hypothetical protein RCOM_1467930 [Ricinus communis]|uniref:J domain-containing protein n=1 Tax=Ricinus communis TaxID=3988 RepID=B9RLJ9_RICCO|nr:hypothetical protein RCOM_1467930 [Ricinus communis]|eukprot:XP_002514618.1 uncharacterized protein LOC8265052 [Ricinus communis]
MSKGQSQRKSDFRKRALGRCKSKGKASDFIDIDGDTNFNVIIIDAPKPSEWTSLDASTSGKDKAHVCGDVICIDDDDDDSGNCGNAHDVFEDGRKFFSKLSKCWDACSRKISSLSHQKVSSTISSENDDSDCYIEEDFQGNIRQQWEQASLRKKMFDNVTKGQFGFQGEDGPARCNDDSQMNVSVDITAEARTSNSNSNHDNDKFNQSACVGENARPDSSNLMSDGKSQHKDFEETVLQEMCTKSSFCNTQAMNETTSIHYAHSESQVRLDLLPLVSNGGLSDVQNYIIGDREMLKKTDAYRRAQEEEWASRQRELQIQAEEARRLRKRRKAETQRLLETERRQKQRVEEVREAQKKDEETLNLKEQLRIEVRRELDKLEANCTDMASLLRGLGIDIGGGFYPSSTEVRTAYKQALLRFHPDRASRSDIRQQIEAEEKFKLISRAKEKFML